MVVHDSVQWDVKRLRARRDFLFSFNFLGNLAQSRGRLSLITPRW